MPWRPGTYPRNLCKEPNLHPLSEPMVLCVGPTLTDDELSKYREEYLFNPDLEEEAVYFSIVSNPIRLKVLHLLRERNEVCVCDMKEIFDISMPAMSQHLAKLRAHKFVQATKRGQTVFYALSGHPFLIFLAQSGIPERGSIARTAKITARQAGN